MSRYGLNSQDVSLFLADPPAQLVTSARGAKRTYRQRHLELVAVETEDGGWVPKKPGRTLYGLGNIPQSGNFAFVPNRVMGQLGELSGLANAFQVCGIIRYGESG